MTARLKAAVFGPAERLERSIVYLPSSQTSKEDLVHEVVRRDRITGGLVCLLECVEPCSTFEIHRNRKTKTRERQARHRRCLHPSQHLVHDVLGLVGLRIQTWLPLNIQVCSNGRERLSRQMDRAGIGCHRHDNTFTWIEDFLHAHGLLVEVPGTHRCQLTPRGRLVISALLTADNTDAADLTKLVA